MTCCSRATDCLGWRGVRRHWERWPDTLVIARTRGHHTGPKRRCWVRAKLLEMSQPPRRATYQDVKDAPENLVAELIELAAVWGQG